MSAVALPSPFLSLPVIPYVPNQPGDRAHAWDWPGHLDTQASGVSVSDVDATQGTETITLGYVGLSRSEARTLEAFVEARAGRKEGFWCPTFQHDFFPVDPAAFGILSSEFAVRDWGFLANVFPLTTPSGSHWPYYFAFARNGYWTLAHLTGGHSDPGVFDTTGARIVGYQVESGAGTQASTGPVFPGVPNMISRLLWVRFADDAITTEWDHPRLANITLRVQHIRLETLAF